METIDSLINDLLDLGANLPFVEYYSHTDAFMYKIINPYTKYKSDKIVLSHLEDGLLKALTIALPIIALERDDFTN